MHAPVISLVLLFGLASCGGSRNLKTIAAAASTPTQAESEAPAADSPPGNSEVVETAPILTAEEIQEIINSAAQPEISTEAETAIAFYTQAIGEESGLSLTLSLTAGNPDLFKAQLTRRLANVGATQISNPSEIYVIANSFAVLSAIEAGYPITPDLVARLASVALIHGQLPKEDLANLMYTILQTSGFREQEIGKFLNHLFPLVPNYFAENFAASFTDAAEKAGISTESALEAVASNLSRGSKDFARKAMPATIAFAHDRVSDSEIVDLIARFENAPNNGDLLAYLQELLEDLLKDLEDVAISIDEEFRDGLEIPDIVFEDPNEWVADSFPLLDYGTDGITWEIGKAVLLSPMEYGIFEPGNGEPFLLNCEVIPALPMGLYLDPNDCSITGIPLEIGANIHNVVGTNTDGFSVIDTIGIEILGSHPQLKYGSDRISVVIGSPTVDEIPEDTGIFDLGAEAWYNECVLSPAELPGGMWFDDFNCSIYGNPWEIWPLTSYTATLTNDFGNSVSAPIEIEVLGSHPTFRYGSDLISVEVGSAIPDEIPADTGTLDFGAEAWYNVCVLSPSELPFGMWFDDLGCAIYGQPYETWPLTTYTATIYNSFGNSDSDTIQIEVLGSHPTLRFGSDIISVEVGSPIPDEIPADTGTFELGAEAWQHVCVLSPSQLPPGMWFDDFNCAFSGQPYEAWPLTTYTVTLYNNYGNSDSDTIQIEVLGSTPILKYGSDLIAGVVGTAIPDEFPENTGVFEIGAEAWIDTCSLSPSTLPSGMWFDDFNCSITGQPDEVWPQTTYTATLTNNFGNSANATIDIVVTGDLTDDSSAEFQAGTLIGVRETSGVLELGPDIDCDGTPGGAAGVNCTGIDPSWAPKYTSLIGHYPFDAGFDDQINEASLSVTNATLSYDSAKVGPGALELKAASHSVTMPATDQLFDIGSGDFSFAFWFLKTGGSGESGRSLVSWTSSTTGVQTAFTYDDAGTEEGMLTLVDGGNVHSLSGFRFPANKWHHFVATRSGTNLNIYLNGLLHGSVTSTTDYSEHFAAGDPIALGSFENSGVTSGPYMNGLLDALVVWNTALDETDIKNLYDRQRAAQTGIFRSRTFDGQSDLSWSGISWTSLLPAYKPLVGDANGNGAADDDDETAAQYSELVGSDGLTSHAGNDLQTGLVTYLPFDGPVGPLAEGSLVQDTAGGLDFTVVGDGVELVPGLFNQALKLDGTGDFLELDGLLYSPAAVSVSMWFHLNQSGSEGSSLWSLGSAVNLDLGPNSLQANYRDDLGGQTDFDSFDEYLRGAGWQHVVVVVDPANMDQRLYINGAHINDQEMSSPIEYLSNATRIGASGNAVADQFANGLIDEVAVWSRSLRPQEVEQLYRRGANRLIVQVRACDEVNCTDNPLWLGPDGDPGLDNSNLSGFSEQYNSSIDSAVFQFENFPGYTNTPIGQTTARFFQYRVIFETDQPAWSPKIQSVTVTP